MSAVHISSPALTESDAVRKLRAFSKEVIIEAFLSVSPFLHVDSVVSECKEIDRDRQFKMLMKRDEELSRQRLYLQTRNRKEALKIIMNG